MLETSLFTLLLLSCGALLSQQIQTYIKADSKYSMSEKLAIHSFDPDYIMGIFEFTPELPSVNYELSTVTHFQNYTRIIREAAEQEIDILVFPQCTLNNVAFPVHVSHPLDRVNPCLQPEFF